jgi:hypothetical protein
MLLSLMHASLNNACFSFSCMLLSLEMTVGGGAQTIRFRQPTEGRIPMPSPWGVSSGCHPQLLRQTVKPSAERS